MSNSSTLPSYPGKSGLWPWLLRSIGLEAWFQQAPAAAHAGQEERILLFLTPTGTTRANHLAQSALLTKAYHACEAAITSSGGELIEYQTGTLLITWPLTNQSLPPVATFYFQLRDCLRRLAGSPTLGVSGAAGLGWATPGAVATPAYEKASLREATGVLHESQQLRGVLLLTAALHHYLAPTISGQCTLHVAFEVPGHRYPATLYQVLAPTSGLASQG